MSAPHSLPPKHLLLGVGLCVILFLAAATRPSPVHSEQLLQATPTGILAEAAGEVNLRNGPGLEYELVGKIYPGTRYEVLGRSEFYPWLLLAYPEPGGGTAWVYQDLVTVTAAITQIPITRTTGTGAGQSVSTPDPAMVSPTATLPAAVTLPGASTGIATQASSSDSSAFSVFMEANSEINVRFGPGIDYPRIGRIAPGERFGVISRHALYPWLLIDYPPAPSGTGWIFSDVVTITGNLYSLPVITVAEVGWPTLTPTPPFVVTAAPPWGTPSITQMQGAQTIDLPALGEEIQAYLLAAGFAPEEETFGSVFVLDLQSGANFSLGQGVAYSGMSLIKIPILVEFFRQLDYPPDPYQAEIIVNTMICSGNHTANDILALIGNGDPFTGAQSVTETMQALGLLNTFVAAPFKLGDEPIEFRPVVLPEIPADQSRTFPDPFNQSTPEDLGWLLGAVYQCAASETGPLMDVFPGQFTPTECRQMIRAMSQNQIGVLTEAGVPPGTTVAHKHGWINDTHGDASIVLTDGGDFVLTMALYGRTWLPYEQSWPLMAEIARMAYNAYNPEATLAAIHPVPVDEECDLIGNPLLAELQQSILPSF